MTWRLILFFSARSQMYSSQQFTQVSFLCILLMLIFFSTAFLRFWWKKTSLWSSFLVLIFILFSSLFTIFQCHVANLITSTGSVSDCDCTKKYWFTLCHWSWSIFIRYFNSVTFAIRAHNGLREREAVQTVQRWNCVIMFITTATTTVGVVPSSKSKDAHLQRQQLKFQMRTKRIPTCHSKVRARIRAMHHQ